MCFAPEVDLVAGVVVTAVGVDSIRRARAPEELPLASLPLLLGIHLLIEVFVWRGLEGSVSSSVGDAAIWTYLAIAFILPVWVPLAVRGVEPSRTRQTIMTRLAGVGLVAMVLLFVSLVRGPVGAAVEGHHIAYFVDIPGGGIGGVLYVIAACGALLASSDRLIRIFGVSNLVAVTMLAWLTVGGLTSLWCVWAAVTSVAINRYLRQEEGRTVVLIG
ncbi:MAG: DUF6629 family protein [Actinomycetota bacterium]